MTQSSTAGTATRVDDARGAAALARRTGDALTHEGVLDRAAVQARERRFDDVFIVDADFHHIEGDFWSELLQFVPNEVIRDLLLAGGTGKSWIPGLVNTGGMQEVGGRIQPVRARARDRQDSEAGGSRDLRLVREAIDAMSVDRVAVFPQSLLGLGASSFAEQFETQLAFAYARWVTERMIPEEPRVITMLYLPFSDPEACLRLVEEFGDRPGVVGFMVTTTRFQQVHAKQYMPLYRALEERNLVLSFHGGFSLGEHTTAPLNKFVAVHSIGFPLYHMIHVTNWLVNGLPERFPKLKVFLIEGGVAWIPFLMRRLDHEVMMRPSEAPLLQRLPSEYMRDFFYTTQPLEASPLRGLQEIFEQMNASTQLLWSSDWPHWDWEPPSRVWDLPFLDEQGKRGILGTNACRLFDIVPDKGPGAHGNGAS